ncbi:unnamed protein product [Rhizoctonia solani]|uniref:Uncharacterized protein n=1 Tax=Rhizoctonia solani TaxID=456999 RepID=A0A8H3H3J1_9AGAM|nr:unnamed protein product [Rhizoctonia solani]
MTQPKTITLVNTDDGDRPQLVHHHYIKQPQASRLVRFAALLGLAKEDKPLIEAAELAYEFITRNYAEGDQVILYASARYKWETDPYAKAAEVLARHLHDRTSPAKLADAHPGNGGDLNGSRIPIYAVVACPSYRDEIQSMSTWSDWLRPRFPPVQHMVCFGDAGDFRSCSTMYDMDGALISEELRFSSNVSKWELWNVSYFFNCYYLETRTA